MKSIHPLLILGLCLLITAFVTYLSYQFVTNHQQDRIGQLSEIISNSITSRINRYENSLRHIYSYIKTDPKLSRNSFKTYVEHLRATESYPGVQGLGYTVRIRHKNLASYEKQVQAEGFTNFKVWPRYPREDYFSIHYLEPFNWRNQRAFGFDMYSQPDRQKAMNQARDSGKASLTEEVILVQETDKETQPGFLIYIPIYAGDTPPETIPERRDKLQGFVYAPFRAHDFFNEIFSKDLSTHSGLSVKVYDGDSISPDKLLYSNDALFEDIQTQPSHLSKTLSIHPLNHQWTVVTTFRKSPSILLENISPLIMGIIGTMLSFLIFWIFHAARTHTLAMEISLTRFNALVANLTEGLIIVYPNGDIQLMNQVAAKIYQFNTLDKIVSKREDYKDLFNFKTLSGVDIPFEERPIGRVLKGDKYSDYELELIHTQTGKRLYASYGGTPIYNNKGKLVLVVVTVKDITEKKKIEIELREALSVRDEFMSISSHELKTPLTSLKLKTQLFKRKLSKNQEISIGDIQNFSETIDYQVSRLTRLVDDMLDISRLRSGKFTLSKEKVNFCEILHNTLEQIKPQFIEAGYQVPELRNLTEAWGYWDPLRIEQVITNLLTNAIRYGEKKPVSLEVKTENQFVYLSVKDLGEGISPEQQKRIFNRFERLTDIHETTGLGLGLFLSQKIMEAHDGSIWVESQKGEGSIFYIKLPIITTDEH